MQVHSDAIQAGLETIKKLLDGRIDPINQDEDEDDDVFFENLEEEDSIEAYGHHVIAA